MKEIHFTFSALALLTLTALKSPAQSTYEPYTFTTFAGGGGYSTNAAGTAARFLPLTVAVDSAGNIYVADWKNHVNIDPTRLAQSGMPTSLAAAKTPSTNSPLTLSSFG